MSTQPAIPAPSSIPAAAYAPTTAKPNVSVRGLSLTGPVLLVISLLVVASGYTSLRPEVLGLRVHPYLLPVAVMFPFVVLARITEFPIRVLVAMLTFLAMYCFSVFAGSSLQLNEVFKSVSAAVTIVTCALLVRRGGDFVAGALGLSIAVAVLAWPAMQQEATAALEVMQGANKNSYSLFALPALLLAGFIATRMKSVPLVIRAVLVASTFPTIVVIFMSANRSGYLGTVVVGFLLFWDRRGRGVLVVGAVAAAVIFWMTTYGTTAVFDERMELTTRGHASDDLRMQIMLASAQIALENPVVGVSPTELPIELGRRLDHGFVDPHNVFGHVAAGSGLICLVALLAIGWTLFFWKPRYGAPTKDKQDPFNIARTLMRMLLFLWFVRGMFSREILYNPSFCIAIGLTIGLCIVGETHRRYATDDRLPATGRGAYAV